jgi:acyl carrier protein
MSLSTETPQIIADFIVRKILKRPNRILKIDEPLLSRGVLDSLTLVDLALFVEDTFGVRLKNAELTASTFDSIEQLANLIEARRKK